MAHRIAILTTFLYITSSSAWQSPSQPRIATPITPHADDVPIITSQPAITRRSIILHSPLLALTTFSTITNAANPPSTVLPNLDFVTTPSGLQYADVKQGSTSSPSPSKGQTVSIDYVMSTTGARYGSKIYSTQDAGAPYRWILGDGSTIPGLEEAVSSMTPGGIRRVIIPAKLGYQSVSSSASAIIAECQDNKGLGPVPPAAEALGEFQRFKNIYCNPDRQYQPDLVMDVKLYGRR